MTIVIEDGTGLSTAEAYISVADATTYFSNRGVTGWAALASDAVREASLRKATDYMTAKYRHRWKGVRYSEDQALCWPRMGVVRDSWQVDIDEVPVEVKYACAELALKSTSATLLPDLTQGVLKEKIGPIETEYDKTSPRQMQYSAIERMLSPYLGGGGPMVYLVRC